MKNHPIILVKTILHSILALVLGAVIFAFWLSPRQGGLIPWGKEAINPTISVLHFDTLDHGAPRLNYPDISQEPHLVELRTAYALDTLMHPGHTDLENVLAVQHWVRSRWQHDGEHAAGTTNAIDILRAAEQGERFRCVEYSMVTTACLAALGYRVRGLGLMARDIGEVRSGGGHAANEVYLRDLRKWMFLDPQYDIITFHDSVPLNAVELQRMLALGHDVDVVNPSRTIGDEEYLRWIGPYLYYIYVTIDRQSITLWDRVVGNKKQLTLYPIGAEQPAYFQRMIRWNNTFYTHALRDLYPVIPD